MKTDSFKIQSRFDNIDISCLLYAPDEDTEVKAIVQIAHGMCEHKERFIPFMEFLCRSGYICVISDHRGHGESVLHSDDLGYFYSGGADALVDDLLNVNETVRKQYPTKPLYLFGHSMGSLAVRSFTKKYDRLINGLIVCGSPSRNPAAGAGKMLTRLIASFKGDRHRPKLIQNIAFESFNKKFESEGRNAWLTNDKEIVKAYNNDPLCTYQFTCNGFIGLFDLMQDTYSSEGWTIGRPDLPVHFVAGADDPCITSRKDFESAVRHMENVGYRKVSSKLYDGLRHEILNETEKQKVFDDILLLIESWG
jgi:alpha-beta hydrolase superfamily lysophospholipase